MLRTFPIAGKPHIAFAAVPRQVVVFIQSELLLLGRVDQRAQPVFHYVSELVLRIHVMVAGINVAIVLDREGRSTSLPEHA
jgi:hypothetical protein